MLARLNLIGRPLENENPPSLTEDQITTHHVHHLETILKPDDFRDLEWQIHDADRQRSAEGRQALS